MKTKVILSALIITSLMLSCNLKSNQSQSKSPDIHTSQISLDWNGTYYGVIPCASCPGIEVILTIESNNEFKLVENYLTSEDDNSFVTEGTFEWLEDGSTIVLKTDDDSEKVLKYKVEENRLRQLDTEGNIIEGDLASKYLLFKTGNSAIENQKWQLTELNGKAVEGDADTHYIFFDSKENKIHAKGGCNILQFEYLIINEYRLITKPGISTLMACPDDVEDRLVEAITMADNITYGDNKLSLNKARMAPLAIFERVED